MYLRALVFLVLLYSIAFVLSGFILFVLLFYFVAIAFKLIVVFIRAAQLSVNLLMELTLRERQLMSPILEKILLGILVSVSSLKAK